MATLSKSFDRIRLALAGIFYNPAKRYITDQDEINAISQGAMQVARDLGGLQLSQVVTTQAGVATYVVDNQHKKLVRAQYLPAGETVPLHIAQVYNGAASLEYLQQVCGFEPAVAEAGYGLPGLIVFDPMASTVTLYPAPVVDGDSVTLGFRSLAVDLGPGIDYDGDQSEIKAIAYAARITICEKLNEMNQAALFEQKYDKEIERCKVLRSKMNAVAQLQDGRFEVAPLRSVNGEL